MEQTHSTAGRSRFRRLWRRLNRPVMATCLAASVGIVAIDASPTSAAAPYWRMYDTKSTDRCSGNMWILVDGYGRLRADALFDFTGDCQWDSRARDADGNGTFDEFWFDNVSPGGAWDVLLYGNQRFDTQNGTNRWGMSYPGPYGTSWAGSGYTSATIGGAAPTTGTAGGAFWNLMVQMAARSGVAVW